MNAGLRQTDGHWSIAEADHRTVVDPLLEPESHLLAYRARTVVLDPGHGGRDDGARSGAGLREKQVVLDLARRIRVHRVNAGLKVHLTREGDRKVELEKRTRMAAAWNADAFVSVHVNKAANVKAAGIETYVLPAPGYPSTSHGEGAVGDAAAQPGNRHDAANTFLGWSLQRALLQRTGGTDRGVKRARFVVLRNAPCPAALVECGFLSNEAEAAKLGDPAYLEQLAVALSKGVLDYAATVERAKLQRM